ncbi:MAG: NAD(P)-dependent glycerol-3-phosphate dehydrogenase [Aestuariivita sp.]|nr:NAD(P)-dependent glycerol-3-phosphate dehydrogenase [Aestuariivita sp.]
MTISVLGAGAFGTALACLFSAKASVTLWCRSRNHTLKMRETRVNHDRLPSVIIPNNVIITYDINQATQADIILLTIPMQSLRSVLDTYADFLTGKQLVVCCKGMEVSSHLGPLGVIRETFEGMNPALLTGPSFAHDIACELPTALVLACQNNEIALKLQEALTCQTLRIYRTFDTIGAELGGALKNVIAIACGTAIGAGLGESARAALMTRGFSEMVRLATALGGHPRTLSGLSGLGDLALTCGSEQSRNFCFGLALGSGSGYVPKSTIEGVATAKAMVTLAKDKKLDLPITETVAALVEGHTEVETAIRSLLSRPLNVE